MFHINGFYLADSLNAMAEKMVGRCVTIMDKWLHNCFYIFDSHICNSQEYLSFYFYFSQSLFFTFFCKFFFFFFYILAFLQLVYLYGYTFSYGKDHLHTLNTMTVKYPCLVCDRAVEKIIKQPSIIVVIGGFILLVTI